MGGVQGRKNTLAAFENDVNWAGDYSFLDNIDKENYVPNKAMPSVNKSDFQVRPDCYSVCIHKVFW